MGPQSHQIYETVRSNGRFHGSYQWDPGARYHKNDCFIDETVGSTDPTDGILDPMMPETFILLHETVGSVDPTHGILMPANVSCRVHP